MISALTRQVLASALSRDITIGPAEESVGLNGSKPLAVGGLGQRERTRTISLLSSAIQIASSSLIGQASGASGSFPARGRGAAALGSSVGRDEPREGTVSGHDRVLQEARSSPRLAIRASLSSSRCLNVRGQRV